MQMQYMIMYQKQMLVLDQEADHQYLKKSLLHLLQIIYKKFK